MEGAQIKRENKKGGGKSAARHGTKVLVRAPEPSELLVIVNCHAWLPPGSMIRMAVDGNARGWMGMGKD